jgi:hypothetical protein
VTVGGVAAERRPATEDRGATRDPASARSPALWFGVLGPPLAWGAHLLLGDLIFELGCADGVRGQALFGIPLEVWSWIQTGVLAAVILLAGLAAWRAHRRLRDRTSTTEVDRARAMALAGMGSAALYLAIVLYGVLPPLLLHRCSPSL